ncbi:helix-turn-helix transcriptional regulator [Sinanaerobacter sp. ZZT-01]|uniref:helix-turn-helix domain-containing protein n=1 Tax=Sinanaerobacter sp. ZZT-01 TaxID=3111540 RepID=UPI002D78AF09|nr:helix-turn-helix transcriptional regulator [Sinanaerobacter sp. ZZT-01]WRR94230.1 helix-turn-helix transcriptional regulator [Sinanaerobacter sp. ZZT-01]
MSDNNLSQRLKMLRSSHNLTQVQLGELVGLSKQAINGIEHGRRNTTSDKLILFADYFDVSVDYLLGRTDNPEVNK